MNVEKNVLAEKNQLTNQLENVVKILMRVK